MDERLQQKLVERYPEIFRDYGGDMRYTCMAWGIECGDGWFELLNSMCHDVVKLCGDKDIQMVAHQVKEKFGGLRFYFGVESKYTILKRLDIKIRNLFFSHKFGIPYWKIVKFRRKIWKTIEEKISDRIDQAEIESEKTCEACGKPGKMRGGSWIYTACDSCEAKYTEGKRRWKNPEEFPSVYEQLFGEDSYGKSLMP